MTGAQAAPLERRFATRHYPYRGGCGRPLLDDQTDPLAAVPGGSVVRFFLGGDPEPVILDAAGIASQLGDPFATLVLAPGHRPLSTLAVLAILDAATTPDAVPGQRTYRIADGGQIAWSAETSNLDRQLRIVITRHRGDEAELFISTTAPFDSEATFLQIFAWDPVAGAYNFYERRRGVWSWAGSSWKALEQKTRGLGPFDSHVNGATVMKELKQPWMHWHSQSAQLRDDFLRPDDPLRTDTLYQLQPPNGLRGAEDLELIVRAGIARWTRSRFDKSIAGGVLAETPMFLRHLLTTTTVNLTSAPDRSWSMTPGDLVRLPTTFFLNSEILTGDLSIPANLARLKVSSDLYLAALARYSVKLQDGPNVLDRDTFFAFAVPEASAEDRAVVAGLLQRGILSRTLAASLLMVDFPNPIFSARREALLTYVPDEARADGGGDLDARFSAALRASPASAVAGSPEAEFLGWWNMSDDGREQEMARQLDDYWTALTSKLASDDGFDGVFRLAESRRRQFRERPLAEFGLTLAVATALDIPVPLIMTTSGEVTPAT
jgi:hypothetical protein